MAHEVEQMMYVGDVPWHKLGHRFVTAPSLDDAIVAAGLNWQVTTEPVFSGAGETLEAKLTRRSSDQSILGVVGPNYEPLQNQNAFSFFAPFIETGEATIETAGSLRQGKRVFVLAKINRDPMVVKGNDIVNKYVLLSNSHDGTLAVRVGFTPIRVVCNNTMQLAHNSAASKLIRVRHTRNVVSNLEEIRNVMNLADSEFEATAQQYRLLASKEINQQDLEKYVKLVFGKEKLGKAEDLAGVVAISGKRLINEIQPLFEKGRGNDMPEIRGTYWAAYNAISEYLQYNRGREEDTRLDNLWFGQGAALNKKALDAAMELAIA
jgi:phage/plasmid-like protein (TIGR03299 family)